MNTGEHLRPDGRDLAAEILTAKYENGIGFLEINYQSVMGYDSFLRLSVVSDNNGLHVDRGLLSNLSFHVEGIAPTPLVQISGTLDSGYGEIYRQYMQFLRRNSDERHGNPIIVDMNTGVINNGLRYEDNFTQDTMYPGRPLVLVIYDYSTSRYGEEVIWPTDVNIVPPESNK